MVCPSPGVRTFYRSQLAKAVREDGADYQGVSAQQLASVLEVGLGKTWSTPLHAAVQQRDHLPHCTWNGQRTFLPADLQDADADPLRQLARATQNPFVASAIFDVLWARFKDHLDGRAAIDARVDAAKLLDPDGAWTNVALELARATVIAHRLNDSQRIQGTLLPALNHIATQVTRTPAAFVGIVNEVCHGLLTHKKTGARCSDWAAATVVAAGRLRDSGSLELAEDALMVAAALATGLNTGRIHRLRLRWMLQRADASSKLLRAGLIQRAMEDAIEKGLTDVAEDAKGQLEQAIKDATTEMKQVSVPIDLPGEIAKALEETAVRTPSMPGALRALALADWMLCMPVGQMEAAAEQQSREALFFHFVPSIRYRDGKVAGRATSPEEKLQEALARNASLRLAMSEVAAETFLLHAFARFEPTTLAEAVGVPAWMDARRLAWLDIASRRFAEQDVSTSGTLGLLQYEGMLRDLLRASGDAAMKVRQGATQDETLNALLQRASVRALLGEEHAWFVEFLLCRPEMGPNMRNELCHSNLSVGAMTPGRALIVWLLLIRLSLFDGD